MIPTIRIKSDKSEQNPAGFVVINASDYDPAQHEIYGEVANRADDAEQGEQIDGQGLVPVRGKPGRKPKEQA